MSRLLWALLTRILSRGLLKFDWCIMPELDALYTFSLARLISNSFCSVLYWEPFLLLLLPEDGILPMSSSIFYFYGEYSSSDICSPFSVYCWNTDNFRAVVSLFGNSSLSSSLLGWRLVLRLVVCDSAVFVGTDPTPTNPAMFYIPPPLPRSGIRYWLPSFTLCGSSVMLCAAYAVSANLFRWFCSLAKTWYSYYLLKFINIQPVVWLVCLFICQAKFIYLV